ncbi:pyrroline-5-carboxylate reductase [Adlercreutzia sp. ZJ141]|uniref:pyrroline-5-carboxylate reductase n=1 Tax=Adlercreutzia sp. ZJ141 TaxID=2709406 RepID=UPI0013EB7319|nr:pyrroline-5-carboxylate reductase [Adlercreutzia sp. ZJ141]
MARVPRRIAVIGGGKMGEAIFGGWIASTQDAAAHLVPESFSIADPGNERRAYLSEHYGVSCVEAASQVPFVPDMVVLAVKPQVMMSVLDEICSEDRYAGGAQGPLFVSIAAGLSTERLETRLPHDARLVRVMPNTPLMVGQGASGVCGGSQCSDDDVQLVQQLFECLGRAFVVPEKSMDAIGAISGSGPAYVASMIEMVRDAGEKHGLDPAFSEVLFLQTVLGTAQLMNERGQTAEQTRIAVCSPGGTTLAALDAMNRENIATAYQAGVDAAVARSKELALC